MNLFFPVWKMTYQSWNMKCPPWNLLSDLSSLQSDVSDLDPEDVVSRLDALEVHITYDVVSLFLNNYAYSTTSFFFNHNTIFQSEVSSLEDDLSSLQVYFMAIFWMWPWCL